MFSDWRNQFFLLTIQTLKNGACGGSFFKDSNFWFGIAGGVSACKKNALKGSMKKWTKIYNTKSGPRLEISYAVTQPFFSQGSQHIWFDASCLRTACTLFPGTDLKYNPPPYLRKLTAGCILRRLTTHFQHQKYPKINSLPTPTHSQHQELTPNTKKKLTSNTKSTFRRRGRVDFPFPHWYWGVTSGTPS